MYEVELFPPTGQIDVSSLPVPTTATITAATDAKATALAFATHSLSKPVDADTWH